MLLYLHHAEIFFQFIGLFSKKKDKMYYHIGGNRENIKYNKIGLTF